VYAPQHIGNLRPYLFNSMLDIPDDIQGRVSAGMDVVSEIPALLLSGLVGAASDKLGRRAIYAMGFLILAVGYFLFPFVADDWTLLEWCSSRPRRIARVRCCPP
jgi:MFS family permease